MIMLIDMIKKLTS